MSYGYLLILLITINAFDLNKAVSDQWIVIWVYIYIQILLNSYK